MNLGTMRASLSAIFPNDTDLIQSLSRYELESRYKSKVKKLYLPSDRRLGTPEPPVSMTHEQSRPYQQPTANETYRALVLCANDETVNTNKALDWIHEKYGVDTSSIDAFYINSNSSELQKDGVRKFIVDANNENTDIFPDECFDFIVDEHCPFGKGVSMNTFKWIYRILKTGGILMFGKYRNPIRNDDLYNFVVNVAPKMKHFTGEEIYDHLMSENPIKASFIHKEYTRTSKENFFDYYLKFLAKEYLGGGTQLMNLEGVSVKSLEELDLYLGHAFKLSILTMKTRVPMIEMIKI